MKRDKKRGRTTENDALRARENDIHEAIKNKSLCPALSNIDYCHDIQEKIEISKEHIDSALEAGSCAEYNKMKEELLVLKNELEGAFTLADLVIKRIEGKVEEEDNDNGEI